MNLLSILICSIVEREQLLKCLYNKLSKQNVYEDVEILVYTDNKQISVGTKRNCLINNAKGKYVCFIDDDAFPHENWLQIIIKAFMEFDNIGSLGGRIIQGTTLYPKSHKDALSLTGKYNLFKWAYGSYNVVYPNSINIDALQGTNMCFKTNLLKSIGGFDAKLAHGYASFEDTDVCLTLKRMKFDTLYIPDAVVVHGLEPRAKGYSRDLGIDYNFTYSYARNGSLVHLKNSKIKFLGILILFSIVLLINAVRIFLPIVNNKRLVDICNKNRINSFKYFLKGIIDGTKLYFQ